MGTFNRLFVVYLAVVTEVYAQNLSQYIKNVRDCFAVNNSVVCVKERTLDILNETIYSDESINLFNSINITRNKEYMIDSIEEFMPSEASQRSLVLTDAIRNKIEDFFMSRLIQIRIGDSVEARKKGGGIFGGGGGGGGGGKKGGGGGILILIGVAMAGVLTQLFMGKIALAAGAALLLAKIALTVTLISSFKKSSTGGGGKESAHVVYAPAGGDSYSHGYGSWHRSMIHEEDPQNIAYNGYASQNVQYH